MEGLRKTQISLFLCISEELFSTSLISRYLMLKSSFFYYIIKLYHKWRIIQYYKWCCLLTSFVLFINTGALAYEHYLDILI